ncbi:pteridine reductase [Alteromonas sp. MB-3u-76]|uniref:pteridine reductase n=1 Tax=Alteromonas sp. MB-3u-76 TaxID=2058133 RepID=UPI000C3046BC|nr:pteridine reductase [Alteromonas sp. MB-3u-76]AUC88830.1 pteridine reductase [Alteromonas sp. MB-3u-76]
MEDKAPVALVTGAAKRIGATLARRLHANGYRVVVHYSSSYEEANSLVNELNHSRPNSAISLQGNLCDSSHIDAIAERSVEAWGRLDVLVNNASSFYPTPMGEITEDDWSSLVGSNTKGPLFLSQALVPALKQTGGCIINMVDMHLDRPLPKHSVYLLAKAGLASLTRSMAIELAPQVRINGIAPGAILWPERDMDELAKQRLIDSVPLQQLGSPEDIADALSFLVSASYITGQIIYVDGGRSLYTSAEL